MAGGKNRASNSTKTKVSTGEERKMLPGWASPRKGFLKHFCKLFLQNGENNETNNKIILLSMIFSLFTSIFLFFDAFLIIQFFAENQ